MNPCSSREHINDLDNPGFCLWCRAPMPCSECGAIGGNINCKACSGLPAALERAQRPSPVLAAVLQHPLGALGPAGCSECGKRWPVDADHAESCSRELAGIVINDVRLVPPVPPGRVATIAVPEPLRRYVDVSLLCSACGAEFPEPCAADCPRPPDTIAVLLAAVSGGATLMLTGPDLLAPRADRTVSATLESASGASYASVEGPSLGPVLVELARRWLKQREPRLGQRSPGERVCDDAEREREQPTDEPAGAADLEQRRE